MGKWVPFAKFHNQSYKSEHNHTIMGKQQFKNYMYNCPKLKEKNRNLIFNFSAHCDIFLICSPSSNSMRHMAHSTWFSTSAAFSYLVFGKAFRALFFRPRLQGIRGNQFNLHEVYSRQWECGFIVGRVPTTMVVNNDQGKNLKWNLTTNMILEWYYSKR
jgi:hypothetical protein